MSNANLKEIKIETVNRAAELDAVAVKEKGKWSTGREAFEGRLSNINLTMGQVKALENEIKFEEAAVAHAAGNYALEQFKEHKDLESVEVQAFTGYNRKFTGTFQRQKEETIGMEDKKPVRGVRHCSGTFRSKAGGNGELDTVLRTLKNQGEILLKG